MSVSSQGRRTPLGMLREPEVAETKDRGDGGSGTTSQLITRDRRRSNERYQQVPASVTPLSLSHCRPKHARPESTFDARRKITTSYSGRRLRPLLTAAYNMALVPKPSATRELGAKDTCWVRHSPRVRMPSSATALQPHAPNPRWPPSLVTLEEGHGETTGKRQHRHQWRDHR